MENQNEILWSPDEMIGNADQWSLAGDVAVLNYLKKFSEKVLTQTVQISDSVDHQVNSLNEVSLKLDLVKNEFHRLRNTQFIESRVYEDDETIDEGQNSEQKVQKTLTDEQKQDRIKTAILRGVNVMKKYYDKVEVDVSDSEDENEKSYVLKPQDLYTDRPLPYIVGTEEWHKKWHVGLLLSESDTESEKDAEIYSSSDSDSALPKDRVPASETSSELSFSTSKNLGPAANSTFNDTVERKNEILHTEENDSQNSFPSQAPISNQNFAQQLAEKLGNVISAEGSSDVNQNPIKKPAGIASSFFSDEPPPLDDFDDTILPKSSQNGLFSGGRDLFANDEDEEDLFSKPQNTPAMRSDDIKPKAANRFILPKTSKGLFDESDETSSEEDMFEKEKKILKKHQETIKSPYLPPSRSNMPPLIDDQPPEITPKSEKKKPIGGVSIFGEGSNLFGAAPPTNNLQPSKSLEIETQKVESQLAQKDTIKKLSLFDQSDEEDVPGKQTVSQKVGKKLSLFDDSDDEDFTPKKVEKSDKIVKKLSLFDSDDDSDFLSSKNNSSIAKITHSNSSDNKSNLFGSGIENNQGKKVSNTLSEGDNRSISIKKVDNKDSKPPISSSNKAKQTEKKVSLFESDSEESSSILPGSSTLKTSKKYASIFDDDDDLFGTTEDSFLKKSTPDKPSQNLFDDLNKNTNESLFDILKKDSAPLPSDEEKKGEVSGESIDKDELHNDLIKETEKDVDANRSELVSDNGKHGSLAVEESDDKTKSKQAIGISDYTENEMITPADDKPSQNLFDDSNKNTNESLFDILKKDSAPLLSDEKKKSEVSGESIDKDELHDNLIKETDKDVDANRTELVSEDGKHGSLTVEELDDKTESKQATGTSDSTENEMITPGDDGVRPADEFVEEIETKSEDETPININETIAGQAKVNIFDSLHKVGNIETENILREDENEHLTGDIINEDDESNCSEENEPIETTKSDEKTQQIDNILQEQKVSTVEEEFSVSGLPGPFECPKINILDASLQQPSPPLPHIGLFDPTPPPIEDLSNDDSSDGFDSSSINDDYSHDPADRQRSSFFDNEPPLLNPNESSGIVRDRLDTDDSSFYPHASSSRRFSSDIFNDQQSQDNLFITKNHSANALQVSDLQKIPEDVPGEDSSLSKIDLTPSGNINDFVSGGDDSSVFENKGKFSVEDETPKPNKKFNLFDTSDEENDFIFNSTKKSSITTSITDNNSKIGGSNDLDEVDKQSSSKGREEVMNNNRIEADNKDLNQEKIEQGTNSMNKLIKALENPDISSEKEAKTGSPPKKLKHNLQINVGALLPGAARPKVAKSVSFEDVDTKKVQEKKVEPAASKSEVLVSVTKDRVRIPVKRRPSTRKGRQEAIRNSIADFRLYQDVEVESNNEEDKRKMEKEESEEFNKSLDLEKSFNEEETRRISLVFDKSENKQNEDIIEKNSFDKKKNLSIYKVPPKSSVFDEGSSSDSEDLFKTSSSSSKNDKKPVKSTPNPIENSLKTLKKSLFTDDEPNPDLFDSAKIGKNLTGKPVKSLFDDSDQGSSEDDLFGVKKSDSKQSIKAVDRRPVKTATVKKLDNKKVDGDDPLQALK